MLKIKNFLSILDEFAPLELSKKLIEGGDYDNSGVIVNSCESVNGVLFSLDLSAKAVAVARRQKCNTIVTHHPAIYYPISSLDMEHAKTAPLLTAVQNKMNVISMHLNLDIAKKGIDYYLAKGLGAGESKILDPLQNQCGYGREFCLNKTKLHEFVARVKKVFNTNKVIYYGNKNLEFNKVASFCGAGASHLQKMLSLGKTDATVFVTSDVPHHVINELVQMDKALVILPHFASENYGFKRFFESVSSSLNTQTNTYFFEDKRFL